MWYQETVVLNARSRGFHLITDEICRALSPLHRLNSGMLYLFLQHTSASLTLNESCDRTVRQDMERYFLALVPDKGHYLHHAEGPDDMPAHIKSSLLGVSLAIPVQHGHLALGTWQGIWLGEHRINSGQRHILATLHGESV